MKIHVPGRELDRAKPDAKPKRQRREVWYATFTIRLRVEAGSPAGLWRHARRCEQLLRELAPAGTTFEPVELQGKQGPNGKGFRLMMREAGRSAAAQPAPRPAVGVEAFGVPAKRRGKR